MLWLDILAVSFVKKKKDTDQSRNNCIPHPTPRKMCSVLFNLCDFQQQFVNNPSIFMILKPHTCNAHVNNSKVMHCVTKYSIKDNFYIFSITMKLPCQPVLISSKLLINFDIIALSSVLDTNSKKLQIQDFRKTTCTCTVWSINEEQNFTVQALYSD